MGHLFHSYVSHLPGIPTSQALRRKERSGRWQHCIHLALEMPQSALARDIASYGTVLSAVSTLGSLGVGKNGRLVQKKTWFILIGLFFPDVCTVYQTWGATFIKIKTTFLKVNGSSWRGGKMNEQHTHTHTRQERIFEKIRQELSPVTCKPA